MCVHAFKKMIIIAVLYLLYLPKASVGNFGGGGGDASMKCAEVDGAKHCIAGLAYVICLLPVSNKKSEQQRRHSWWNSTSNDFT